MSQLDLGEFANSTKRLLDESTASDNLPVDELQDLKRRTYRQVFSFVDALGGFENAHAVMSLFTTHLGPAIAYRYPVQSVDETVTLLVRDMLEDGFVRRLRGYSDDPDELEDEIRDQVSAGITADNAKIAELFGEEAP